jgi:hypothetical protein
MRGGGDCDGRPTKTKWASDRGVNYSRDQANAPTPENPVSNRAQPEGPPPDRQRTHGRRPPPPPIFDALVRCATTSLALRGATPET